MQGKVALSLSAVKVTIIVKLLIHIMVANVLILGVDVQEIPQNQPTLKKHETYKDIEFSKT